MKPIQIKDLILGTKFSHALYFPNRALFLEALTPILQKHLDEVRGLAPPEVYTEGVLVNDVSDKSEIDLLTSDPHRAILKLLHTNTNRQKLIFDEVYNYSYLAVQNFYVHCAEDTICNTNDIRLAAERIYDFTNICPNFPFLLLEKREDSNYLYDHAIMSAFYTLLIASAMDYSKPRALELVFSSLIADCGMSRISSSITDSNKSLSAEEMIEVQKHPVIGYQYLTKTLKLRHNQAVIAYQHHENYDGTGYPSRSKKTEIEEVSCIYTIADNFSALVSDRPWRKAFIPYDAMKMMISTTMNKFDLNILRIFLNKISIYPVGSYVELSDGSIARVLEANNAKMLRPSLYILRDGNGQKPSSDSFINLVLENELTIVKAIEI
jgi:HD-GYP domain-containing protein (c-di-GMP phosphodiesterase class II)